MLVAHAIVAIILALSAWHDLCVREVQRWVPVAILAVAILGQACLQWHGAGLAGWGWAAAGLAVGLLLSAAWCLFGGLGGGDVTLLAALGALLGLLGISVLLAAMLLAGLIQAIWCMATRRREFAYVPAIFFGYLAAISMYWTLMQTPDWQWYLQ